MRSNNRCADGVRASMPGILWRAAVIAGYLNLPPLEKPGGPPWDLWLAMFLLLSRMFYWVNDPVEQATGERVDKRMRKRGVVDFFPVYVYRLSLLFPFPGGRLSVWGTLLAAFSTVFVVLGRGVEWKVSSALKRLIRFVRCVCNFLFWASAAWLMIVMVRR